MKKPKIEDLNLLSDELYLQAIKNLKLKKFMKDSQKPKEAEKEEITQSLGLSALEKEQLLIKLEKLGDKSFNDSFKQGTPWEGDEFVVFNKEFTARKNLILINSIDGLVENYSKLSAYKLQKEYRSNLEGLIEMITPRLSVLYDLLYSLELRKKIQGYIAVKQRHRVKHKIFFDILKQRSEKNGKWNSLGIAVQDVYAEVIAKFKEIDELYIERQLKKIEDKKQIAFKEKEEFEWVIDNVGARKAKKIEGCHDDETLNSAKKRRRKLAEELQLLEMQISKYTDAKKNGYPFECLGREILFNSDIELSLINCLRGNKEIMSQVIVKRDKLEPKE